MIRPISGSNFNSSNISNIKRSNRIEVKEGMKDRVSFTSNAHFASESVLKMLQRLDAEPPVLGFKGDGKWLLPNLLMKTPGQKYNLYMPDGTQLSYLKSAWNDNVLFSLKQNKFDEKTNSKIKLTEVDEHLEHIKLRKTKTNNVLSFRVNTKDSTHGGVSYKAGEMSKILRDSENSISEYTSLTDDEAKKINTLLEKYLPYFF